MAKPKGEPTNVRSFKLPIELDAALKDFAASCGKSVTDILVGLVAELVDANKTHIANFRRNISKAKTVPTFTAPEPPKKSARASKKNSAAPSIESPTPTVDDGDEVKGSGDNENS